jgi:hypothetical protein
MNQRVLDFELDVLSSAFPTFDEAFSDLFPVIRYKSVDADACKHLARGIERLAAARAIGNSED